MKIILSRKGFDASWGGCASPIIDGQLVSLPIPDPHSHITYADIRHGSVGSLGPIVETLTKGKLKATSRAHLDPDLDSNAIPRLEGWRPLFGQSVAAQGHLVKHGVGPGDVFLMFGWFREIERHNGTLRFIPAAPDRHVIYGWLQVGEIFQLGSQPTPSNWPAWTHYHPHHYGPPRTSNNALYVAKQRLVLDGLDTGVPGAGRCKVFFPGLQLTVEGIRKRSLWQLPPWFDPTRTATPLSRHSSPERWQYTSHGYRLKSVPIGQEFVFDTAIYPEATSWIRELLRP